MKIEIIEEEIEWRNKQTLLIDDEEVEVIIDLSESPEDAIIGRDLIDAHQIADYIQMGYDAAKRGEELIFI